MAISAIVKTKRDGTLLIEDGTTPAALDLTVEWENGDFNLAIPGPAVILILDRGRMGATPQVRYTDDQPMTGGFSAHLRDLADATYATLMEIISQAGIVGSTWVSSLGATAEVFALNLTFTIDGTTHGDAAHHTCLCPHCVITGSIAEGDPNTISLSFTSYALFPTLT